MEENQQPGGESLARRRVWPTASSAAKRQIKTLSLNRATSLSGDPRSLGCSPRGREPQGPGLRTEEAVGKGGP